MTDRATCKLGLVLPDDLHRRMIAGASASLTPAPARGGVQRAYELAFEDLLQALDAGEETAFAAVRGAKVKVTVRLPEDLCGRIRHRLEMLQLKLTDFTCAAVRRALIPTPGD